MLTDTKFRLAPRIPTVPLGIFAVVAVIAVWTSLQSFPFPVRLAVKALPVALLLQTTISGLRRQTSGYQIGIMLGLTGSLIGDVAIEFNFVAGIGAFLLAHVGYLAAMGVSGVTSRAQAAALVPGAALWGGMFFLLAPRIPAELFIPVITYLTVITLMWVRALGLALQNNSAATWILFVGATIFVISDSMIAINRWVTPIPSDRIFILATYFTAQWLIAWTAGARDA